jgi:hypothetical protein
MICPACGAEHADDVWCACGHIIGSPKQVRSVTAAERPLLLEPPAGLKVEMEAVEKSAGDGYRSAESPGRARRVLTRRWFDRYALLALFVCVAWNSTLLVWYAFAVGPTDGAASLVMFLCPLLHVAVGLLVTYNAAAALVNRTIIVLEGRTARVRHTPLSFSGTRELALEGLRRVYVTQHAVGRRSSQVFWSVFLECERDGAVPFLPDLNSEAQALCIAAHVAEHAGVDGP